MTSPPDHARRDASRRRSAEYRQRRRAGELVVSIVVGRAELHALERLGLLARGERDGLTVANAAAMFLCAAPGVALIGEGLWPAAGDDGAR